MSDIISWAFLLFTLLILLFGFLPYAKAQAVPQFLVSWQANSYVPVWYQGKIFPVKGSLVNISFELIDNGKIADLSKTKVRWYLNDNLVLNENNGLGIKQYSFNTTNYSGQDIEVRIALFDYKGGSQIDKIIRIPVVSPEVVIDAPYEKNLIGAGKNLFIAYPFFFNIGDLSKLSFEWTANEAVIYESENTSRSDLELNIDSAAPKDFSINLVIIIRNLFDEMQFARKNIQLKVK